ncbi:MAG: metallophosphoesterase, partial [Oscillospiraceae bacterium]
MKKYPIIAAGLITGWFLPEVIRDMSRLTVTHSEIRLKRLPKQFDGLKIVHLSDLHNKKYGANDAALCRMIYEEDPDIVIMTGDMISHDGKNKEDFFGMVRRLCQKYPVFYVNGNHELSDMSAGEFRGYSARMKEYGAVCLDNAGIVLSRGGGKIHLYGLSYPARFYRGVREYKRCWSDFTIEDMRRYCGNAPKDFSILLAHNPLDFDVHAEWGADISFGGHI